MAVEKILTHKNGVAEYIITSKEDLNGLVDVEVGSRAKLLSPTEVNDYIYRGVWTKVKEVEKEDGYDDNEIWGIIDNISGEIMDNAVESVNEYHKNLDSLVDCSVTEFEGRDITINPSIEGKTKDIVVKGETYQNLVSNKESSYTLTQGTSADRSKLICETSLIKPNTLYTVIFEVTDINLAGTDKISIWVQYSYCSISSKILARVKDKGIYMGTFTTGNIVESSNKAFRIKGASEQWEKDTTTTERTITFKNVVVLEGDYTNRYIPPYFEGIVGVGDKSKNLFNPKEAVHEYVDSTGNFFLSNNNVRTNYILIKPNTPYIGKSLEGSTLNNYSWFDKNKTFIKRDAVEGYAISPNNAMYLIYHNKHGEMGFTVDLSSVKIQLEEGTVSTPYEPYYDGCKTEILSCGKNLFNESKHLFNVSIGSESSKKWGTGKGGNRWSLKVPCKPNTTYTITKIGGDRFGVWTNSFDFDGNKEQELDNLVANNIEEKTFTFTTPPNAKVVCIYLSLNEKSTNIHLEESPTPTPYAPYQQDKTQILLDEPLMKLPSGVCDTLEQRDDGVYLVRRVGKSVLNGSEDWIQTGLSVTGYVGFYVSDFIDSVLMTKPNIICDKLPCRTNDDWIFLLKEQFIFVNYKNIGIRIKDDILSENNVTNFKAWLESNPITVYYELATPIETKLDIPTANITIFKDVTHISTTNEIKPIINVTLDTTNISKDTNQYFSIENNKNFILPNMDDIENNSIKELNLYMDIKGEYTLTFPSDIKWASNVINLNKADYMSILLKYIKVNDVGLWLGSIRGIDKEG